MSKLIKLTKGYFTVVDDDDYQELSKYKWHYSTGYAYRRVTIEKGKSLVLSMHRQIMRAEPGKEVDHINGNPLDNRKANLRVCSKTENIRNNVNRKRAKSGFKGAYPCGKSRWYSKICVDCRQIYLGTFDDKESAARAFDVAAKKYFGEFAVLNFEA